VQTPLGSLFRFGPFQVNSVSGELLKNGNRVKLQEQPFRLLIILLENDGELVTRDDLRHRIWQDDTFVDFDSSLRVAVRKLREALDDDAESPRYIETIPKRGYRFLGPVVPEEAAAPPQAGPFSSVESALVAAIPGAAGVPKTPSAKRWVIGLMGAAVIVIGLFAYWLTRPVRPPRVLSSTQLTFDGLAKEPPILTDGSRLYFGSILGPPYGLYEVSVTGGEPALMATPNMSPFVFDRLAAIAADSSALLLQSREGYQWRGPLWVVPTVSGPGRRNKRRNIYRRRLVPWWEKDSVRQRSRPLRSEE
jgi:DNA-binding winged helix-turn-helix (wHTH) protein